MATIRLLTDAPEYNLALMKLSAYHKAHGDEVLLNDTITPADKTFASVLFSWNKDKYQADAYGGCQYPTENLPRYIERLKPDYDLYQKDFSLGYTFRPCFRKCEFCLTKTFKQPDKRHHSIYEFHDSRFKKICLMNNNTFFDPLWKETFKEIWKEDLALMEHGLDLRLIDEEKAECIKKTKFAGRIHFAWDRMKDERHIVNGLKFINERKISARVYVLVGYNTEIVDDMKRCQILIDYNQVPYVMPFNMSDKVKYFKNFINSPANWWHQRDNIEKAWPLFLNGNKTEKPDENQATFEF